MLLKCCIGNRKVGKLNIVSIIIQFDVWCRWICDDDSIVNSDGPCSSSATDNRDEVTDVDGVSIDEELKTSSSSGEPAAKRRRKEKDTDEDTEAAATGKGYNISRLKVNSITSALMILSILMTLECVHANVCQARSSL